VVNQGLKMNNAFLQSFNLNSPKDQELLEKVQQEPGSSLSGETGAYESLSDKELVQTWQESECAKGSEAVDLRLEIIRRHLG
jgi:hypothetical protein